MRLYFKKVAVLMMLVLSFSLYACASPFAVEIAEMNTAWESQSPAIQFTIENVDYSGTGFGFVVDSNGENQSIVFFWAASTSKFFIFFANNEDDIGEVLEANDIALTGSYGYENRKKKQVKLEISTTQNPDRLFNGQYKTIIVSATSI